MGATAEIEEIFTFLFMQSCNFEYTLKINALSDSAFDEHLSLEVIHLAVSDELINNLML